MQVTDFCLDPNITYLNHAAVAPWPACTVRAVQAFAAENGLQGASRYPEWIRVETELRERLRTLINADSRDEIALLKNTSEALSVVAWGLPWQSGDNVVISNQEFPSNRVVWQSLDSLGVETRLADLDSAATPEAALLACMDARTRLLSISSVQYGNGLRLDLEALGSACRDRNILFCVDAIQSLGALRFDVQAARADFVMADGHKWLLAPEGLALFYCRNSVMDRLALHQYGWHMLADSGNYDVPSRAIAHSARRFECGSPNMLGIHALHASLGLILATGLEDIERRVLDNTRYILDFLARRADRFETLTPSTMERHAGIVTFRPRNAAVQQLYDWLHEHHIICALRGGGVRFSPHCYTPRAQLQRTLDCLDQWPT
jgi:cysteine desulfurase/selenocysteine lyase